ncbi:type II toxin-antitoxin system VapC family toxin [Deferrisoma camini]|uniref:type II toxin-antitoxin system VapC family toxin n=1 Tax=Deferrisoma camini TaxID=1035120 RepID=UPI00046D3201|nr:type II toxin-antitoxin system VapC family toxin [Deferrisoma camini]
MICVVDASVAAKWFFDEPLTPNARAVLGRHEGLIAPDLVLLEVANVAWKRVARGEAAPEHMKAVVDALPHLFSLLVPATEVLAEAAETAIRLGHAVYDCAYLALARKRNVPLVTADHRLKARAGAGGWEGEIIALEEVPPLD